MIGLLCFNGQLFLVTVLTTALMTASDDCFVKVQPNFILKYASLKRKRPGVHAYYKHPVLLLPSGPDKI